MTVIEKLENNLGQLNSDIQAIKRKIVEKGVEVADGTRPAEYPPKIDAVYEAGKKSEYDAFWDSVQINGNRIEYHYAFYGWNEKSFIPKYDIRPKNAPYAFRGVTGITDLDQWLIDLGVVLDFSQCVVTANMFLSSKFEVLGIIDFSNATNLDYVFTYCTNLKTIKKLVMPKKTTDYALTFSNCSSLENIAIEGEIKGNGFNTQWSYKLSKASIISIINALSTTTSDLTVTISKTAVNKDFETSQGVADGSTSEEWLTLIATKNNWTINLI